MTNSIIIRPTEVRIGSSSGSYMTIKLVHMIELSSNDPLIPINIPYGVTKFHQTKSVHIEGLLETSDYTSFYNALFTQAIDGSGHKAIDSHIRYPIQYFIIKGIDQSNNVVTLTITNALIRKFDYGQLRIDGKEVMFKFTFYAESIT